MGLSETVFKMKIFLLLGKLESLLYQQELKEEYVNLLQQRRLLQATLQKTVETNAPLCNCSTCVENMYLKHEFKELNSKTMLFPSKHSNKAAIYYAYGDMDNFSIKPRVYNDPPNQRSSQKKSFKCLYCEKSFGKSSHLRDHHRTHSGERPFVCKYCSKAFSQFSNLRTHLRIHTGEKPFKCNICLKSFTQRVTLRSHLRTHENVADK